MPQENIQIYTNTKRQYTCHTQSHQTLISNQTKKFVVCKYFLISWKMTVRDSFYLGGEFCNDFIEVLSHSIHFINFKCTIQWYKDRSPPQPILEHFHYSKKELPISHLWNPLIFPSYPAINLPSAILEWYIVYHFYMKYNIYGLWLLIYFIEHHVFKVDLYCMQYVYILKHMYTCQ